jgi:hypothetical protein
VYLSHDIKRRRRNGAIRLHLLLPDATLYCVRYSMINGRNLRCQVRSRRSIVVVNWCWRELQHSKKHVERRFQKILPFHLLWPSWSCLLMTASDQAPSTGVQASYWRHYQGSVQQWAMNLHVNELRAERLKLPQRICYLIIKFANSPPCVCRDIRGIVHYKLVPTGQTVNQVYYLEVLKRLREKVKTEMTRTSCITTMHLLTRHCLWGSFSY